jgi:nucleoside-diphosphate-sugar epimerase
MDTLEPTALPDRFDDVETLEEFLSRPSRALIDDMKRLDGDVLILGVGGKMGPTLARLAKRAAPEKRIVGVARFSRSDLRDRLEGQGIETIACDLLDREVVVDLPRLRNVVFMAGRKFGSTGAEELTWAMNAWVPTIVAETFTDSRIVVFSTGNIYPFAPIGGPAPTEATPPGTGSGEYGLSCLGRERLFQYFSDKHGTPGRILRLNYAIEMRYGVLHDVARKIVTGGAVDLTMGQVNVIWQGDANAQALRALHHCTTPTSPLNVSGPETISIQALALALGERLGRDPIFSGEEADSALLTDAGLAAGLFGYPLVPLARAVGWTADWVKRGMPSLAKATHYEARDGKF